VCRAFYMKTMANINLYIERLLSFYSCFLILYFFVDSLFLLPVICLTLFIVCRICLVTIIYFLVVDKSKLEKNPVLYWAIVIFCGILFVICLTFLVIFFFYHVEGYYMLYIKGH
jgi:hypothetical protein